MDNKEIRVLQTDDIELRVSDDSKLTKLVGYAAKFDKLTDLGSFLEKIERGAFDDVLDQPTVANKNHDNNLLLGRSPKTLRLSVDSVGLKFEVDLPNTTVGRDTAEEIRRGDISGCSFAFSISEDRWEYLEDDVVERTLVKFSDLYDISVCAFPAYQDTSVAVRSLDAFKDHVEFEKKGQEVELESTPTVETEPKTEEEVRSTEDVETDEVIRERQRLVEIGYRRAGRVINRCRTANAESANGSRV